MHLAAVPQGHIGGIRGTRLARTVLSMVRLSCMSELPGHLDKAAISKMCSLVFRCVTCLQRHQKGLPCLLRLQQSMRIVLLNQGRIGCDKLYRLPHLHRCRSDNSGICRECGSGGREGLACEFACKTLLT